MSVTKKCAIKGCMIYATSGIPLHKFHREESMLLKWQEATNINCVSLHTVICSLHFKQSDYKNFGKFDSLCIYEYNTVLFSNSIKKFI